MNLATVRARLILGLSAVIALMMGLCVFAYAQLHHIQIQAGGLSVDSVPGLSIVGRLYAAAISAQASFEQHVAEREPARLQELATELDRNTSAVNDLSKQYESTIVSARDRELHDVIVSEMQ